MTQPVSRATTEPVDPAQELAAAARSALADLGRPGNAEPMRRYMKSALPYRGVAMPVMRSTIRRLIREHPLSGRADWIRAITTLYDDASFREERYAALVILRHARYRTYLDADLLPLLEHLIRTGAWWDLVDEVSHCVGAALLSDNADPPRALPVIRGWICHPDMWLRRAAIICQLGHRDRTDRALLADAIAANLPPAAGAGEFFIRKAIGWALREYGKTDPAYVVAFVAAHPSIAPLSRREALRRIGPATANPPTPRGAHINLR